MESNAERWELAFSLCAPGTLSSLEGGDTFREGPINKTLGHHLLFAPPASGLYLSGDPLKPGEFVHIDYGRLIVEHCAPRRSSACDWIGPGPTVKG
jgi:hypothetical protein